MDIRLHKTLLCFTLLSFFSSHSQLQLNEVVTKNNTSLKSTNGSNPDWIELYNPTDDTINLKGYSLSDDNSILNKWTFTEGSILPKQHTTIFASGESKTMLSVVSKTQEDINSIGWQYADSEEAVNPGTSAVSYTLFKGTVFGKIKGKPAVAAKIYLGEPGDLGYSYAGVHVKIKDWEVSVDRSMYDKLNVRLYLEKDKKANLRFAQTGLDDWQNHVLPVVGTGDTTWYSFSLTEDIGLLNLSIITGLTIIPDDNDFGKSFEFVLLNILFETTLTDRYSTNFKLSSSGEAIILSNPLGKTIDQVQVPELLPDMSYGRKTDGDNQWVLFKTPTPDSANGGTIIKGICDSKLAFTHTSGFYKGSQEIEITGSAEIRYTVDGSTPTPISTLYTTPILIDTSTVLKAACFENGKSPNLIYTNTYFINYETKLPVWSISTNPNNFFSEDSGIYVLGPEGNWEQADPHFGANYWQDWERPVHIQFFEEDGSETLEFDCGIKIFGNYSRANPKKSLLLNFRGKYDMSKLEYPIFPNYPGLSSFDDLLLRGSGGDESFLHFRDGFHAELASELSFEKQKYRPSVVFINGVYWGIHNIREKSNEDFFVENYNIDKTDIDLITGYFTELNGPTSNQFIALHEQIKNRELTYEQIISKIDINSFIDYVAFEVYIANYDWGSNNSKYWRQSSVNGKWRWFMYDTDFSTGIYNHFGTQASFNSLQKALEYDSTNWPSSEQSTELPRKLFEFPEFKQAFVNRYCDLMNTLFVPENVFELLQTKVLSKIQEEVPINRTRWTLNQSDWFDFLEKYKEFWNTRAFFARKNMQTQLDLEDSLYLTLNIEPKEAGYIKLNTIEIDNQNWTGTYFKGIPITLEAIPNPGFSFSNWESTSTMSNGTSALLKNINLNESSTFTATFTGSPTEQLITLSEINYNSADVLNAGDWVEVHNYGKDSVDLSGWSIKDSKLYNKYTVPNNTILPPNGFVVLAENPTQFTATYPTFTALGPLQFSLSNSGEYIYLYDKRGVLKQQILYSDKSPWAKYADGEGGTLDLKMTGTDVSKADSWESICFGGSPLNPFDNTCPNYVSTENSFESVEEYGLSPNPANDYIAISTAILTTASQLSIISSEGRIVMKQKPSEKINISSLPEGLYILLIELDNHELTSRKFIKL